MNPQGATLAAIVISGGTIAVRGLQIGELSPRNFVALGIVAFLLLAIGQFSPELGAALALLVMVSIVLSSGVDLSALLSIPKAGK